MGNLTISALIGGQIMSRRRKDEGLLDDIFEMLCVVPAWVGPPVALLFYLVLQFLVPLVLPDGDTELPSLVAGMSRTIALPFAVLVLFAWVFAEIRKWSRRGLLNTQIGMSSIRDLSWQEFEYLVGEAYRRQGYVVEETGSPSGDGGIDLSLRRGAEWVVVQCKQWKARKVGVRPVRELYGVMTSEGATGAILVTCGSFTREAESFAQGKPIKLIGGQDLWDLVRAVKASGGQRSAQAATGTAAPSPRPGPATPAPQARPTTPASQARPTAPPPSARPAAPAPPAGHGASSPHQATATDSTPACPVCGSTMALRTARKGPNPGSQFWGCPKYPNCRGTRPIAG